MKEHAALKRLAKVATTPNNTMNIKTHLQFPTLPAISRPSSHISNPSTDSSTLVPSKKWLNTVLKLKEVNQLLSMKLATKSQAKNTQPNTKKTYKNQKTATTHNRSLMGPAIYKSSSRAPILSLILRPCPIAHIPREDDHTNAPQPATTTQRPTQNTPPSTQET